MKANLENSVSEFSSELVHMWVSSCAEQFSCEWLKFQSYVYYCEELDKRAEPIIDGVSG
jgi:hypothetical protein